MQESPQLQEERKLERRGWLGCLLAFALAGIIMALVTALPRFRFPVEPAQPAWLVLVSSLLPIVLTAVVGIGGIVLVFRLMHWSGEAERRRQQRGTAVFKQMLPGLGPQQVMPTAASVFSGWDWAKLLLLLLLYVLGVILAIPVVGAVFDRLLPGVPGLVISVLIIGLLCLGAFGLVGWAMGRPRSMPGAVAESPAKPTAQEWTRPERTRQVAEALYYILLLVPLIGVILLIFRVPAPGLLMPVLAMGACTVVFMAINAIYVIAPFLWIAGAVKRGEYENAVERVRLVEKLSIRAGSYLNLHGVILLWAGRYDEARKTFEESIGEQRKEVTGAGSAVLENIGCTLAWQGHYEEAIKMFEGSIAISQEQAMVYSDLAEALLHQGRDLPRALELTERAWTNQQASLEARWLSSYQGSQILANRAWALAQLGRYQEAEETLARAFAVADKNFKPVFAGIHLRAGYVMLARGEHAKANEYFAQGQRLDPQGHYGRLCAKELEHVH
jgi:Flp pilus assembly protein TadD